MISGSARRSMFPSRQPLPPAALIPKLSGLKLNSHSVNWQFGWTGKHCGPSLPTGGRSGSCWYLGSEKVGNKSGIGGTDWDEQEVVVSTYCVREGSWRSALLCTNNTYFVVCAAGGPEYIREVLLQKLRSLSLGLRMFVWPKKRGKKITFNICIYICGFCFGWQWSLIDVASLFDSLWGGEWSDLREWGRDRREEGRERRWVKNREELGEREESDPGLCE